MLCCTALIDSKYDEQKNRHSTACEKHFFFFLNSNKCKSKHKQDGLIVWHSHPTILQCYAVTTQMKSEIPTLSGVSIFSNDIATSDIQLKDK